MAEEQAQQFAETAEKLDLAKAEIARLRVLPVRDVAAAMGWDLRKEIDVDKHLSRATPGPGSPPSSATSSSFIP